MPIIAGLPAQIVWIREQPARTLRKKQDGSWEYQREWKLRALSMNIGPIEIDSVFSGKVATLFDPFESPDDDDSGLDLDVGLIDISYEQDRDTPQYWTVKAIYSNDAAYQNMANRDPLLRAYKYSYNPTRYQRPAFTDFNGNAILNSAGDRVFPLLERDESRMTLTVTRNELHFDIGIALFFADTTNQLPFFGQAADTGKMACPRATDFWERDTRYYEVTYEIDFRPEGWDITLLDSGYHYLAQSFGAGGAIPAFVRRTMTDDRGMPYQEQQLLNGAGGVLAAGSAPVFLPPIQLYGQTDFNALGLVPGLAPGP